MPLQIRRGTAAERSSLTAPLVIGELLYVTDQGRLYIGDGTNLGAADSAGNPSQGGKGLSITGFTAEEAQDAAAILFSNGTHTNITFTYNDGADALSAQIDLSTYTGNIDVVGNINVIDGIVDADFRGSVFADNSTLLVDAVSGSIPYAVLSGVPTLISQFTNDIGYIRVVDIADGTVTIDVNNTGDLQGSVFGDDSTLLVDAVNSTIPASVVTGTFAGNVLGNLTGDVVGIVTGQAGSSLVGNVTGDVVGIVTGQAGSSLIGDVVGIVTGQAGSSLIGDIRGSVFGDDSSLIIDAVDNVLNISTITSPGSLTIRPAAGSTSIQSPLIVGSALNNINGNLHIVRNQLSNNFDSGLHITDSHNTNAVDPFYFRRTRGTPSIYEAVQTNDVLGRISFIGWDGTQFVESVSIRSSVNTVSSSIVSSLILITAMDNLGITTTPYRLNPDGRLQLGNQTDTSNGSVDIVSQVRILPASDPGQPIVIRQSFNTATANSMGISRSRGTPSAPIALQAGDDLFNIQTSGYHGSGYVRSSTIRFATNGPISAGVVPGKIMLLTAGLDGVLETRVEIDETGKLYSLYGIQGDLIGSVFADDSTRIIDATEGGKITTPSVTISEFLQLPVYVNDTTRNTSIPSPQQGMVVFMQSGTVPTVSNKPVIYNGTAWEAF